MEQIEVSIIVGKDGRITIPSKIREQEGIREGDVLKVVSRGQGEAIEITVITK
jgi:AbrB family looped-hinge helix DNA binding protein